MSAIKFIWYTLAGAVAAVLVVLTVVGIVLGLINGFQAHWLIGVCSIAAIIGAVIGISIYTSPNNNR